LLNKESIVGKFKVFSVAIIFAVTVSLRADIFIKEQTVTVNGSGNKQKSETEESTYWISGDKLVKQSPSQTTIIRLDKDVAYLIDNKKKSYMEVPLSTLTPSAASGEQESMAGLPAAFANMMKMKVTVEAANESKEIRSWTCNRYNQIVEIAGGKTVTEMWATEDIKVSSELLKKFSASLFAQNPALKEMAGNMMAEAEKIKGFVVSSTASTKIMGQESQTKTDVTEVKESSAPEGVYEIPAKFKKKKWE